MSDEIQLREMARQAISDGRLPTTRPDRIWGGPGSGASCAVCGKAVTSDQTGFELEFTPPSTPDAAPSHAVHIRCLAAWELERSTREPTDQFNSSANGHLIGSQAAKAPDSDRVLPRQPEGGTMTDGERQAGYRRGPG